MKKGHQVLLGLEESLMMYSKMLRQAAETILDQDVSNYPIFVVHQGDIDIGLPLVTHGQLPDGWMINASILEEFAAKQLIGAEKINDFRELYRSHKNDLCLFVLDKGEAKFVFSRM